MLEFAGAFFEDFELGLGESEHFFRILYFRFFMIVRGIDVFFTADVGRWTQINADKLGRSRFWRSVRSHFFFIVRMLMDLS